MKPTLYIETSVVSYLTARPSRDLIVAALQQITREWWENHLHQYDPYISEIVIREAEAGDEEYAKRRLAVLKTIPLLKAYTEVFELSHHLLHNKALPRKAEMDAIHIAFAACSNMDYLVSWNCKHIANAHIQPKIIQECHAFGYPPR